MVLLLPLHPLADPFSATRAQARRLGEVESGDARCRASYRHGRASCPLTRGRMAPTARTTGTAPRARNGEPSAFPPAAPAPGSARRRDGSAVDDTLRVVHLGRSGQMPFHRGDQLVELVERELRIGLAGLFRSGRGVEYF